MLLYVLKVLICILRPRQSTMAIGTTQLGAFEWESHHHSNRVFFKARPWKASVIPIGLDQQGIPSSGELHNPQYITASKVFQVINHKPNTYYSHAWFFVSWLVALIKLLSITIHQASLSFRRELLDDLPIEMPCSCLLGEFPAMFEYQTVVVKFKIQCQLYIIIYQLS